MKALIFKDACTLKLITTVFKIAKIEGENICKCVCVSIYIHTHTHNEILFRMKKMKPFICNNMDKISGCFAK